ncbi:MAG: tRNA pseudouridine(38-40) synthase TruA [Chitinispirillaceae bacterium]|nr:tRNA pseudouridine(38-40) synthase TruA [Chitinispirillaceae bacterium]
MRYFFRVEYDGTAYGGWQRQDNTASIQGELDRAFSIATRAACRVTGAGRTDAGVHARAQGAHVDMTAELDLSAITSSVNGLLPRDIAIFGLRPVGDDFHARYSALSRRYRYYLCCRKRPLILKRAWPVLYDLNWDRVETEIASLKGTHDFTTFCAAGSSARHADCTVIDASLSRSDDLYIFTIEANRFVYSMVRSLCGTLIDIGRGRITGSLTDRIESRDRSRAGQTAPAFGLVLDNVIYPGALP